MCPSSTTLSHRQKNVILEMTPETRNCCSNSIFLINSYSLFDCFIASCIIFVTLLFVLGSLVSSSSSDPVTEQFYGWALNAWVLSILHSLLVSFEQTYIPDESDVDDINDAVDVTKIFTSKKGDNEKFKCKRLWSRHNYVKLGLGLFKDKYIKELHK